MLIIVILLISSVTQSNIGFLFSLEFYCAYCYIYMCLFYIGYRYKVLLRFTKHVNPPHFCACFHVRNPWPLLILSGFFFFFFLFVHLYVPEFLFKNQLKPASDCGIFSLSVEDPLIALAVFFSLVGLLSLTYFPIPFTILWSSTYISTLAAFYTVTRGRQIIFYNGERDRYSIPNYLYTCTSTH